MLAYTALIKFWVRWIEAQRKRTPLDPISMGVGSHRVTAATKVEDEQKVEEPPKLDATQLGQPMVELAQKTNGSMEALSFRPGKKPKRQAGSKRIWIKYGQKLVTGKASAFDGWVTQCRYYRCFMRDCPARRHVLVALEEEEGGAQQEKKEKPEAVVKASHALHHAHSS